MSSLREAFVWLNDPLNWRGPTGVLRLLAQHLLITLVAVLLAAAVALPLAFWLGHRGRGGTFVVLVGNVSRAMPTLAVLTIFTSIATLGIGSRSTTLALALFAVPPLLANAYIGIRGVDPEILEAARGMGLSERDVLTRVEIPLAVPLIAAGLRTAAVQVVATAPLAALVGGGTLGLVISTGYGVQDQGQILAGGILVALLAVLTELVLAGVQRAVSPRTSGGRTTRRRRLRTPATRQTSDPVAVP